MIETHRDGLPWFSARRLRRRDAGAWQDGRNDVIASLDKREQVTEVYRRRRATIEVSGEIGGEIDDDIGGRRVPAVSYVADRAHGQYDGKLSPARAEIILGGHGVAGDNPEYLEHTVAHLDELGIEDGPLHDLPGLVREGL